VHPASVIHPLRVAISRLDSPAIFKFQIVSLAAAPPPTGVPTKPNGRRLYKSAPPGHKPSPMARLLPLPKPKSITLARDTSREPSRSFEKPHAQRTPRESSAIAIAHGEADQAGARRFGPHRGAPLRQGVAPPRLPPPATRAACAGSPALLLLLLLGRRSGSSLAPDSSSSPAPA